MKHILLIATLGLAAVPASAQETGEDHANRDAEERGFNLMEEGARLFFRGMMNEMEPAFDELEKLSEEMRPALRDFAREMGPALRDLMGEVQDWSAYHPPEMLPNGDIILRRKMPQEMEPQPGDEIEL